MGGALVFKVLWAATIVAFVQLQDGIKMIVAITMHQIWNRCAFLALVLTVRMGSRYSAQNELCGKY